MSQSVCISYQDCQCTSVGRTSEQETLSMNKTHCQVMNQSWLLLWYTFTACRSHTALCGQSYNGAQWGVFDSAARTINQNAWISHDCDPMNQFGTSLLSFNVRVQISVYHYRVSLLNLLTHWDSLRVHLHIQIQYHYPSYWPYPQYGCILITEEKISNQGIKT